MKPQQIKKLRVKTGMHPGSVCYIGEHHDFKPTMTYVEYGPEALHHRVINRLDEIPAFTSQDSVRWLNVEGIHVTPLVEEIGAKFHLHPLILEDIVNTSQRPKLEEYENCIFISLKALVYSAEKQAVIPEQVTLILMRDIVITFQENQGDSFSEVLERIKLSKFKIRSKGGDYLIYALMDLIVDRYYESIEAMGTTLESLEEEVFNEPSNESLQKIQISKHALLEVRRSVYPLREVINRLQKDDLDLIDENNMKYFNDVYDHTIKIIDTIESYRELNAGLKDIYLSSVSLKMNKIMQLLTIVGAIFIPLTFLAGVYGMNFEFMPELHWHYSYPVFWGVILTISGILIYYFRKNRWL